MGELIRLKEELLKRASISEVAGHNTFRIEDNFGVPYDDYLVAADLDLNDAPVKVLKDRVMGSGIYSDRELEVALELGHVVCEPRPTKVNGSSIDVRLGENFYLAGDARNVSAIFNPFDQDDVNRYFGEPLKAKPFKFVIEKVFQEIRENEDLTTKEKSRQLARFEEHENLNNLDEEHPLILLRPNERILAHTHEFIGIRPPGTTSMQSRSTTGRIGVASCFCAGWGDPGYINRWTMEVNNLNEREYVPLPLYYRIAQIVFSATGSVATEYAKATGKYQTITSDNFEELEKNWAPEGMKPLSSKDVPDLQAYRKRLMDALAA
jgi:dCTP deaminase